MTPKDHIAKVREALKDLICSHGGWLHHSYGIEERIFPEGDPRGLLCKNGKDALTHLTALEQSLEWRDIKDMPKNVKEGYMRVYSFKPEIHEHRAYCNLDRAFKFERHMGHRTLDMFMDIPQPPRIVPDREG